MDIMEWMIIFILIFMLHNLEEVVMVEKWIGRIYPRVVDKVPLFIQKELNNNKNMTSTQFAWVVLLVSIFASILMMVAIFTEHYSLFVGLNFIFALNVFTHPLQSLFLRAYTPGLITSLLLIIPYNILFINFFARSEYFTYDTVVVSVILFIIFIPVFFLCHRLAERWRN